MKIEEVIEMEDFQKIIKVLWEWGIIDEILDSVKEESYESFSKEAKKFAEHEWLCKIVEKVRRKYEKSTNV